MKLKKGDEIVLKIDSLVYGGSGIGSHEGLKIFVDGVAPGDMVKVAVNKIKSNYAEAKLLDIVEPSPFRIEPKCKHFGVCGGCKWQFLNYENQCKIKENQVRDVITKIGRLDSSIVQPIILNESAWYYRNKMELSFDTINRLGLYPKGYHYEVFDLEECFLQSEFMVETVQKVREFQHKFKIPGYDTETHEGLLRNLIIREGKNTNEAMVNLITSTGLFEHRDEFIALFKDDPRVTSLYWTTVYNVPGQPTWTEENLLLGKPALTEVLYLENGQKLEFDILPQAFFQTNTKQAEKLYSIVVELAGLTGKEVVFDLYCGTGTIGLFCAHKAKEVVGIEENEHAIESARGNALKNGIKNASFYLGRVESRLKELAQKPDVVIVDPPRAGLGLEVVENVAKFGAAKIVYVSCNPATLARDLSYFTGLGYSCESVQPVDMFPQTHHVESVAVMVRG